jgi:hypothetical protein
MVNGFATTLRKLEKCLGSALLAVIAGTTTDQIARWSSGDGEPTPDAARRLRATADIVRYIATVDAAPVARAWLMGSNPDTGTSPAETIAAGQIAEARAAARAFVSS